MYVLLLGAGAVGQVYGLHLQRAGAQVDCLVRTKYVSEARAGFKLYRLQSRRSHQAHHFQPEQTFSDLDELAGQDFDQVWLCVPTDALDDEWLSRLASALRPSTVIVTLQPGVEVQDRLRTHFENHPIVSGLIGMVSYQTPLDGEARPFEEGVAFYLPRFTPSIFSGPTEATTWIVRALRSHGCPARRTGDAATSAALSSCLLMPQMVALEAAGWSLEKMWQDDLGDIAARACRQATVAVARQLGRKPPLLRFLYRSILFRLVFLLGKWLAPFPLEPYLAYHFTKVRAQTQLLMESYHRSASRFGLPNHHMAELFQRTFKTSLLETKSEKVNSHKT